MLNVTLDKERYFDWKQWWQISRIVCMLLTISKHWDASNFRPNSMTGVKSSDKGHFWKISERRRREHDDVIRLMMAKLFSPLKNDFLSLFCFLPYIGWLLDSASCRTSETDDGFTVYWVYSVWGKQNRIEKEREEYRKRKRKRERAREMIKRKK